MKLKFQMIFLLLATSFHLCFANEAAQVLPYYEQPLPSPGFSIIKLFSVIVYSAIIYLAAFGIFALKKKETLSFSEIIFAIGLGLFGQSLIYLDFFGLDFSTYIEQVSSVSVFLPMALFTIILPYSYNILQVFTLDFVQQSSTKEIPSGNIEIFISALKSEFEKGTELFHDNTIISKNNGWAYKKNGLQEEMFVRDDHFFYINDIAKNALRNGVKKDSL